MTDDTGFSSFNLSPGVQGKSVHIRIEKVGYHDIDDNTTFTLNGTLEHDPPNIQDIPEEIKQEEEEEERDVIVPLLTALLVVLITITAIFWIIRRRKPDWEEK